MTALADSIVDWGALWQVVYISAIAGVLIAAILGVGIVANLKATEPGGSVALTVVTVISVLLVAAAVVVGIYYITDKS
jgi:hypothetical protein